MSGIIEFLKDWDFKKNGWPALVVAVIFTAYEVFSPKDPSCTQNNKYLQSQNIYLMNELRKSDSAYADENRRLLEQANLIKGYEHAYKPYTPVLKNKKDETN